MSIYLAVEVVLPVVGEHVLPGKEGEYWREDYLVNRVEWRAFRREGQVYATVTAYTAKHDNVTLRDWDNLPDWVPAAPAWFEAVVEEMRQAVSS